MTQSTEEALPVKCPKCRGAWIREKDAYGDFVTCLSCGGTIDIIIDIPIELHRRGRKPGSGNKTRAATHGQNDDETDLTTDFASIEADLDTILGTFE